MGSDTGIAKWRIAMLVIGVLVSVLGALGSVLLALLLSTASSANANSLRATNLAQAEHEYNLQQDAKINLAASNQATIQAALTTLTANVSALTLQVAHISDRQDAHSDALNALIQQSRPKR
jgi:septal ring factor EnvC (AmiA/AmiB activator)